MIGRLGCLLATLGSVALLVAAWADRRARAEMARWADDEDDWRGA